MDKRNHKRYTAIFSVRFQNENAFIDAYTRDISAGGLFIKTNVFPPINSTVLIKLHPPHAGNPIELLGRVVHVIDAEKAKKLGREPGFGIEFVDMDDEKKAAIESIIKHLKKLAVTVHGRRRCPRMPYETEVRLKKEKTIIPGRTLDISLFGAYIVVPLRNIPPGMQLDAEFAHIGELKNVPLRIRIVHYLEEKRAKELGKEEGYGVEFLNLPERVYIEIYKMMERWLI